MLFNFKNKNIMIILLLILVIASVFCFMNMQNTVEGLTSLSDSNYYYTKFNFVSGNSDSSYITLDTSKLYKFKDPNTPIGGNLIEQNKPKPNNPTSSDAHFSTDSSFNFYKYVNDTSYDIYEILSSSSNLVYELSSVAYNDNDISNSINFMFSVDNSGYIHDVSNSTNDYLNLTLYIDDTKVISNGLLADIIDSTPQTPQEPSGNNSVNNVALAAGGAGGSVGNINFQATMAGFPGYMGASGGMFNPMFMLPGTQTDPLMMAKYNSPYFSTFESAMNMPSNPVANPINAMNPKQYSDTLFSPSISPMMAKTMCKNMNAENSEKVQSKNSNAQDSNQNPIKSMNSIINSMNSINSKSDTLLAQNSGSESGSGSGSGSGSEQSKGVSSNAAPCPPCGRCPEQSFDCKKVPSYEQGNSNGFLPRPVLSDFSTFGM